MLFWSIYQLIHLKCVNSSWVHPLQQLYFLFDSLHFNANAYVSCKILVRKNLKQNNLIKQNKVKTILGVYWVQCSPHDSSNQENLSIQNFGDWKLKVGSKLDGVKLSNWRYTYVIRITWLQTGSTSEPVGFPDLKQGFERCQTLWRQSLWPQSKMRLVPKY